MKLKGGKAMLVNKEMVKNLMYEYFEGNYNAFARALGLNPGHLHRLLNKNECQAGPKVLGSLVQFCESKQLDYKKYIIFLPSPLHACNGIPQPPTATKVS
jgi:hypothetical protein